MDEVEALDGRTRRRSAVALPEGADGGVDEGGDGSDEVPAAPFDAEPAAPEVAPFPPEDYVVEQLDAGDDPTVRIFGPDNWSTPSLPLSKAYQLLREFLGL